MMENRRPVIWPWVCVILFLVMLQTVSPPQWPGAAVKPRATGLGQASACQLPPFAATEASLTEPAAAQQTERVADCKVPAVFVSDHALGIDEADGEVSSDVEEATSMTLVSSEVSPRVGTAFNAETFISTLDLERPTLQPARPAWPARVADPTRIDTPSHLVRVPEIRGDPADLRLNPAGGATASAWLHPQELLDRLDRLNGPAVITGWSRRVSAALKRLTVTPLASPESAALLTELDGLLKQGQQQAGEMKLSAELVREWRRAQYAVQRRLQVWQSAWKFRPADGLRMVGQPNPEQLASSVAGLEVVLARGTHEQEWREFLLVDALYDLSRRQDYSAIDERTLARRVLRRLDRAEQDARRKEFLADAPLDQLAMQLRSLTDDPVDRRELLTDVERYEQTLLPSDARYVADNRLRLVAARRPESLALAKQIDEHYRACNLRIAITADLLNRLLPEQAPSTDPVRTTIVGLPVFGRSTTHSRVELRLIPDSRSVKMELVASGTVNASTQTSSGPVDAFSHSTAQFEARKPLQFTLRGLTAGPAQATARSNQRLQGLRTKYDNFPLVGSVVREMALDEHDEKHAQAKWESEQQVRQRAERQFDEMSGPRLAAANQQIDQSVIVPLRRMGLQDTPVAYQTTAERVVFRARLATDEQLAAHTPRAQAPSDSLASLQVHQSALNNVIEQLGLEGKTFQAPDLMHHVAKKLNRDNASVGEEITDRLWLTFAEKDAVQVQCQQGRVELTLKLAELVLDNKLWRDLVVRVGYVPESQGNRLVLVRDGSVSLAAERLNTRSQFILRGLFSRIFSAETSLTLLGDQWANNPKLRDTEFSQISVEDGWISVALTPRRATR
ncbi:MAG: hypothetical protein AB7O62_13160 [Pirellulales bacterium]